MLTILPIRDLPEVRPGVPLAALLAERMASLCPQEGDVLVVTQKIVSKAEGRFVSLRDVMPSARALELAGTTSKDARLVELVLREASEVIRAVPGVLITRHRSGLVMANSGIDRSNLGGEDEDRVLLLPEDSDSSANAIRSGILKVFGCPMAVIITDSFGRPWRNGVTNVAIGASGFPAVIDKRGEKDRDGRVLEVTQIGLGDIVSGAAALVMGEGAEGVPAALVRGLDYDAAASCPASSVVRPAEQDLFR